MAASSCSRVLPFRRIQVPVLAITGAKDIQVDPRDAELLAAAAPMPFVGHVVPDVTHVLREDDGPPSIRSYRRQVRRPVDRRVLDLTAGWLGERVDALADDQR